jgi:hypothetical protein
VPACSAQRITACSAAPFWDHLRGALGKLQCFAHPHCTPLLRPPTPLQAKVKLEASHAEALASVRAAADERVEAERLRLGSRLRLVEAEVASLKVGTRVMARDRLDVCHALGAMARVCGHWSSQCSTCLQCTTRAQLVRCRLHVRAWRLYRLLACLTGMQTASEAERAAALQMVEMERQTVSIL